MKFKTRLMITFTTIILVPFIFAAIAFLVIGSWFLKAQPDYGLTGLTYEALTESIENLQIEVEELMQQMKADYQANPQVFEDTSYFMELETGDFPKSSYIIVRKGIQIYYTGNVAAAEQIFADLPQYTGDTEDGTIYISRYGKFVNQFDFTFSDGAKGTLFLVTKVNNVVSRDFLWDMALAVLGILIVTGWGLTAWISKGLLRPINELNIAMGKIKEGNFDYTLSTENKGEIGELYRNYEDMRLRLKENAEEQERQEKQNRELISNISHDLKTPITAIKGYVEGILDGVADTPEKREKYLRTVYNKANDMDRLINELTIYSGIDNNRIPYNFHRINVTDYFDDCVEEVGLDLESRGIKLSYVNLVEPGTIIIADPEQLKKVVNNIISNSVKYMDKPKGAIEIRILDEVDSVRVELEDNGKGIAMKDLPRIFERFYRTDASRNSMQGGSGIGLSIVKKIIEDHGGYIWATSKEGEGACIHFVIRKYKELYQEENR